MESVFQDSKYDMPFVTGYALQEYHSAENGLAEAKKVNYTHWYLDASLGENIPSKWNPARIYALKEDIQKHGVKPIFHGNYRMPLSSEVATLRKMAIEYVKEEIDLAACLGAPVIVHGGAIVEPRLIIKAKKTAIGNFLNSVQVLVEYAQSKNVQIYLENLSNYKNYKPFHYIFTHLEEFEYILSKVPEVKFFIDIGHANICEGNPVDVIKRLHNRIVGMSFSNNDGIRDQHLRLKNGTIDYKEIVSTILSCHWKGIIAFETRGIPGAQSVHDLYSFYLDAIPEPLPLLLKAS